MQKRIKYFVLMAVMYLLAGACTVTPESFGDPITSSTTTTTTIETVRVCNVCLVTDIDYSSVEISVYTNAIFDERHTMGKSPGLFSTSISIYIASNITNSIVITDNNQRNIYAGIITNSTTITNIILAE